MKSLGFMSVQKNNSGDYHTNKEFPVRWERNKKHFYLGTN